MGILAFSRLSIKVSTCPLLSHTPFRVLDLSSRSSDCFYPHTHLGSWRGVLSHHVFVDTTHEHCVFYYFRCSFYEEWVQSGSQAKLPLPSRLPWMGFSSSSRSTDTSTPSFYHTDTHLRARAHTHVHTRPSEQHLSVRLFQKQLWTNVA